MSVFRSAATKFSHSSTLPSLSLHKDLRALQDLITSEKAVLQTLQKLAMDFSRSAECLRVWGRGEGEDLADTLSASTTLLMHVSSAFTQLATHEETVRTQMKAVRKSEEDLDELKKRRKAIGAQAEAADKKLGKMNSEHKNYVQHVEMLNALREQIRKMDWDILTEEAKLGDFKRTSAKNWMLLKYGGLVECAEKATIVGDLGRLIVDEIPIDETPPGQPRAVYAGQDKTQKLLAEAQRCITEVVFDPSQGSYSRFSNQSQNASQANLAAPPAGAPPVPTTTNDQVSPLTPSKQTPPQSAKLIERVPVRKDSLMPGQPSAGLEASAGGRPGSGSTYLGQDVELPGPGLGMDAYITPTTETFDGQRHDDRNDGPPPPTGQAPAYDEFGAGTGDRRERPGTMPAGGVSSSAAMGADAGRTRNVVSLDAAPSPANRYGGGHGGFSTVPARSRTSVSQYLLKDDGLGIGSQGGLGLGEGSFGAEIEDALKRRGVGSPGVNDTMNRGYGLTQSGLPRGAQAPVSPAVPSGLQPGMGTGPGMMAWVPSVDSMTTQGSGEGEQAREKGREASGELDNPYEGVDHQHAHAGEHEHGGGGHGGGLGGHRREDDDGMGDIEEETELAYARSSGESIDGDGQQGAYVPGPRMWQHPQAQQQGQAQIPPQHAQQRQPSPSPPQAQRQPSPPQPESEQGQSRELRRASHGRAGTMRSGEERVSLELAQAQFRAMGSPQTPSSPQRSSHPSFGPRDPPAYSQSPLQSRGGEDGDKPVAPPLISARTESSVDVSLSDFPIPDVSAQEEERARNVAAAREVQREMDALSFSPPLQGMQGSPYQGPGGGGGVNAGLGLAPGGSPPQIQRSYSPLVPPALPFAAGRAVSPDPNRRDGGDGEPVPARPERARAPPNSFLDPSQSPGQGGLGVGGPRGAPAQAIPSSPLSPPVTAGGPASVPGRPAIRIEGEGGGSMSTVSSLGGAGYVTPPEYAPGASSVSIAGPRTTSPPPQHTLPPLQPRYGTLGVGSAGSPRTPTSAGPIEGGFPRTISASAFKRVGGGGAARAGQGSVVSSPVVDLGSGSRSGSPGPGLGLGGGGGGYPEVAPLALRKKSSQGPGPGQPYSYAPERMRTGSQGEYAGSTPNLPTHMAAAPDGYGRTGSRNPSPNPNLYTAQNLYGYGQTQGTPRINLNTPPADDVGGVRKSTGEDYDFIAAYGDEGEDDHDEEDGDVRQRNMNGYVNR